MLRVHAYRTSDRYIDPLATSSRKSNGSEQFTKHLEYNLFRPCIDKIYGVIYQVLYSYRYHPL